MLKKVFTILSLLLLLSCSKEDDKLNRNPYLTSPVVSLNLNLNLPEYNALKYPGSYVIVPEGIKGIIVYCVSESQYWAFDLTDPNHVPNHCSRMIITEGLVASCPCPDDDNEYNITSFGQHRTDPGTKYAMQQYFAQRSGDYVSISN